MAADGCISAHHQKMREQLGEKMGGCARGSGREGTMAWKVRDTGGAWWDVKEETTVWWWVRRQVMDETEVGWGGELKEREDEGEQLCCSWHLHRKHLGKLSIRQACLIDFLLFSISISLRVPLSLQNVPWCQLPVGFFFPLYILYAARQDQTVTVTSTVLKQQAINILDEELKICLCHHFTNAQWKWKLLFLRRMC